MIRFVKKRSPRVSIDSYLSRSCRARSKAIFQREGKTHRIECNQASCSTKDPNKILSFQKHLQHKNVKHKDPKTHTHTTRLTDFIFQKQVKIV